MADSDETHKTLLTSIRDLDEAKNHNVSWSSQLQNVCEATWSLLDQDVHHRSCQQLEPELVDAFVHLLSGTDAYELAKLVIPELRPGVASQLNESRRRVLDGTGHMRARALPPPEDPLYRSEKEIFAQAELFRAKAAFENTHAMSIKEMELFRIWWYNNPLLKGNARPEDGTTG